MDLRTGAAGDAAKRLPSGDAFAKMIHPRHRDRSRLRGLAIARFVLYMFFIRVMFRPNRSSSVGM
jgi:hypothetical protein